MKNYLEFEKRLMREQEKNMRNYLLNNKSDMSSIRCFMYPAFENTLKNKKALRCAIYTIGSDIICVDECRDIVIYVNVPYILFIIYINMDIIFVDDNARVIDGESNIWNNDIIIPDSHSDYYNYLYKNMDSVVETLNSDDKINKIVNEQEMRKSIDNNPYYDIYRKITDFYFYP